MYLVRLGNYQDDFFMVSVVDITQRFRMVSVLGLFMVSVAAGNVFLWFPSLVSFLWFPSRQETFSYGFRRGTFSYGFRRGTFFNGFRPGTFFNGFRACSNKRRMRRTEQLCPLPVRAPLSVTCPCPPVRYLSVPPCPLPAGAFQTALSVTRPCPPCS